ncbi:MAG: hypothetical protein IKX03_05485 [Bacteroidales bacterium]|nr:hypothetical protein [Bacteroidales bacterium]MBR5056629.1 hypothetical protein [Bacteroidales bacterium]
MPKVLKSYGTAGAVIIGRDGDVLEELKKNEPVFIDFDGLPVPFFIESIQPKGGRYLVKLEDIDSLAAAEEIVGREVRLTEDPDGEDEDDGIVGRIIRNEATGDVVGPVVKFIDFSGNTCIEVEHAGGKILLPLHEDLIKKVRKNEIFLTIPDGLL